MPQMRLVMKWASRGSLPFMKMLYPRKIDEVLWHSATSRFSKSILVKIPRLPTMRVIGSQFISTRLRFFCASWARVWGIVAMEFVLRLRFGGVIAGREFGPGVTPLRLFVQRRIGDAAQRADDAAVRADDRG